MNKTQTTIEDQKPVAVQAVVQPERAAPVQGNSYSGVFSGERSVVSISVEPGEGGNQAVFVGVQSVGFQLPRGKSWNVPREVANVLRDAQRTDYVRNPITGLIETVESPRFSFIAQDVPSAASA